MSSCFQNRARRPRTVNVFAAAPLLLLLLLSSSFAGAGGDLLPAAGAASSVQLGARRNTYSVTGQVFLPDNRPASGVIVKLVSDSKGLNLEMVTGDRGQFEFRYLTPGTYRLTARNPADLAQFTDAVQTDTANTFTGNMIVTLNLRSPEGAKSETKTGLLSVAAAAQRIPKKARKLYEQGNKFREEKKHAEALDSFTEAIAIYPEYFQALTARGALRLARRQFAEAERDLTRAIELDADYEPALREAGYGKLEQRDYGGAADYLARAVKLDPTNASTHLMLGVAHLEQGQFESAEQSLKQALRLNPLGAVRARVHLANLYSGQRRYPEAVNELQIYLTYLPAAPDAAQIKAAQEAMRARIKN